MKKIFALLIALICISGLTFTVSARDCDSYSGSNQSGNNYSRWASPVESYLYVCADGKLMKVQYLADEGRILVEYYSADYKRLSAETITPEFPVFGGFYAVGNNYFVLTGQNNPSQSETVTCFAVTKYDNNWNKIATAELKDCNTTVPFNAGSARFTHSGNYLVIRTSHEMYKADDGYNHQANVTITVDMSSMKITDSFTDVANVNYGYVSHSFNQFIKADGDKLVAVDHGDAYPRSVVLIRYMQSISSGKVVTPSKQCTYLDMFKIHGDIGDNTTGCSVGGFEITSEGYIVALNSVIQGGDSDVRNIYLCYTDKNASAATCEKITDYTDESASTPQLVKISENSYILLWSYGGRVQYCRVDGKGRMTGEILTFDAYLSDCQPVVHSDKIIWYVWNDKETTFYTIDINDISKTSATASRVGHEYETESVKDTVQVTLRCKKCGDTRSGRVPSKFELYWETSSSGNTVNFSSAPGSVYHPDEKIRLMVKFTAADFNEYEIISSDENVVKIIREDGYFKAVAVGEGKAKVTVKSACNPDVKKQYSINISHTWATVDKTPASCINDGKTTEKCSECGITETKTIAATGHSMSAYKVIKEATCKAAGQKISTCSSCGYEEAQEIAVKAHDKKVSIDAVSPTCTKQGKTEGKKCSICGKITVEQETVEALGHSLGKYEVTKKPTCTAKGEETAKCTRCSYAKTRDVDKVAHTEVTVKATSPTCTKQGKTEGKKCSLCGKITVEQETVEALGHNLGKYEITKKPTCTAKGEETAKCTRCSYTKTRDVDKVAHTEVTVKATSPTCTKQGKTEGKKCSVCGKITVEQESVESLGHSLGKYEITKKPTCTAKGEETAKCTRCSYTKTRDVDKVAHTEVTVKATSPTCTKQGKTEGKKCSVCDKVLVGQESIEALGHDLSDYRITKEATCSLKGEKTAECSRCTYTKTADIPKLKHEEVTLKAVKATCTKSGKTEGTKCSVCDKVLVAQESVSALGHSKKTTVISKATTQANGKVRTVCKRCDKDFGETRVYRIQSVTLSKTKYTCDGKVKTPDVTVIDYNKDPLEKDKDYTVTYQKGRKAPGEYKVTVKFKGRYSGKVTLYFEIKLAKVSGLTATAGKAAVTLKWDDVRGADGYQIYYSTSKDGKYKKLSSTSQESLKKSGLKSGKKYYFKVRAYRKTDEGTVFGSFSAVKSAKIK